MTSMAEEFQKNPQLRREHIDIIKTWMTKQPHLPKISDIQVILFLHSCDYKLEATKNTIDNYFTVRTIAPEIFEKRDPDSKELQGALNTVNMVKLRGTTPEGYHVMVSKLNRTEPENYFIADIIKAYNMHCDLVLKEFGTFPGILYLIDMTGVSLGHIPRLNLTVMKHHFLYLQEGLPTKLQGIHLINVVPFIDTIMNMMKPLMKPELQKMFHYHQANSEKLYSFVPKSMLPKEYGGDAQPFAELHMETLKSFSENKNWFKEEELQRVDESKRLGKSKIAKNEFDMNGSFKKLDID